MTNIEFNNPLILPNAKKYFDTLIKNNKFSGDGPLTERCIEELMKSTQVESILMTTSCTHSLEMSALLLKLKPGDEIIMPSYTFVSTANAYVLRGCTIKFVDIRPDTMNIDEMLIENAINKKTKAIVVVHYAGVSCNMDYIKSLANKYNISVIEDAAQAIGAKYKNRHLGSIGDIGCISFHETKNIHCGEGGAIFINDKSLKLEAEIIREKGTNRTQFIKKIVDKYNWVGLGSSYLLSEINASFLLPQLEIIEEITNFRRVIWNRYFQNLELISLKGCIDLPYIPDDCYHNAHMFYIKCKNINERSKLIDYLKIFSIQSAFHYIPLHSSPAGKLYTQFIGNDKYTTVESERLLRLPLHSKLSNNNIDFISEKVIKFYE